MNIYVSNLSFHTTEDNLRTMFSQYGAVSSAKVIMDRDTGRSRGFGFVEMGSDSEAQAAMQALNNKEIEGRAMSVTIAREKTERSNSGGNNRRW